MFHRLFPPLLFPLFHSTNGVPRRSPSQLFLLFTRFHDAPLVDLLPSHRRVPRKSHWFGSSSTRQDFIDSIATEQSVPPSLPLCLESLLLETLCFLGNFLITTADACFISFLSLFFFSPSSFTLFAFVSLLFFVGYSSHSAVPAVSLARVYFF